MNRAWNFLKTRLPDDLKGWIKLAASIIASLILGLGFSLSIANHFLDFWVHTIIVRWLLLLLLTPFLSLIIYLIVFHFSLPLIYDKPGWIIILWLLVAGGIGLGLWNSLQLPTPMPTNLYHLEIVATGEKNPDSQAGNVCLMEVKDANGIAIPYYEFSQSGSWEERIDPVRCLFTTAENQDTLNINLRAETNKEIKFIFYSDPQSGLVKVRLNDYEKLIDLYDYQPGESLAIIETRKDILWKIALTAFDNLFFILLVFLISIWMFQSRNILKGYSPFRVVLVIIGSLLNGFVVALSLNVHLLDLWGKALDIQIIRMILFTIMFGMLTFVLITRSTIPGFSGFSSRELAVWLFACAGLGFWLWFSLHLNVPLPVSEYTLTVIAEGDQDSKSLGNEICLIEVRDGADRIIPLDSFIQSGNWSIADSQGFCSSPKKEPASLEYQLVSESNQRLKLLFRSNPYAGIVRVHLGDNDQIANLYDEGESDSLVLIDTKKDWFWSNVIPASDILNFSIVFLIISIAFVTSYPIQKAHKFVTLRMNSFSTEKREKINFSSRFSVLILIIISLQTMIGKPPPPERVANLEKVLAMKTDVLYFGDSVLYYSLPDEADQTTIPEFLVEAMPGMSIGTFNGAAFQMDLYYAMCKFLIAQNYRPKLIIIPINLRSFAPEWNLFPAYQFIEEKVYLLSPNDFVRTWAFVLYRFHWFDNQILSDSEFQNTPVYNGDQKIGLIKTVSSDIRTGFSSQYTYGLSTQHRRMKSMVNLVKMLNQNHIPVLFYITPIDYQFGEKYLGDDFFNQVNKNISLIKNVLGEEGISPLNLSYSLDDTYYYYSTYPDEHLVADGRKYVAQQLAEKIQEMLPGE